MKSQLKIHAWKQFLTMHMAMISLKKLVWTERFFRFQQLEKIRKVDFIKKILKDKIDILMQRKFTTDMNATRR